MLTTWLGSACESYIMLVCHMSNEHTVYYVKVGLSPHVPATWLDSASETVCIYYVICQVSIYSIMSKVSIYCIDLPLEAGGGGHEPEPVHNVGIADMNTLPTERIEPNHR